VNAGLSEKGQNMPQTAPYGSWKSPITVAMLSQGGIRLGTLSAAGTAVYWTESRPADGGREVVVKWTEDSGAVDVSPAGFDSRTRVHEYGGGAYGVHGGVVYSSRFDDQRVYRIGDDPVPITPEPEIPAGERFADFTFSGEDVICVRESHRVDEEPSNELVRFPVDGEVAPAVIATGGDFYAAPRVSPDGTQLAWIQWDHPNMPWDGTELMLADIDPDGTLGAPSRVAGDRTESVFQPSWSPDGHLHFMSDRTGWWNLYRFGGGGVQALHTAEADFAHPPWIFGFQDYAFLPDGRIVCQYLRDGFSQLAILGNGLLEPMETPFTYSAEYVAVAAGQVWVIAGSASDPPAVRSIDPGSGDFATIRSSVTVPVEPGCLSVPEPIEFPTRGDRTAHAFFYPPRNDGFAAPEGTLPPLVVWTHGGPTGAATSEFNLGRQFWTSRGFALVDVNYGGSTGYGREYRKRLDGEWGIVDVDDCTAAARYVADQGLVDPARMAIRGGSAGGYTTLAALTFRDVFAAGASYFGVADLRALAEHTHKFESRYLDGMVGALPAAEEIYEDRSPVFHTERLSCPIILLQGLDDRVVPPEQAEMMARALDDKGIPHAYVAFEAEGHGFRRAANIERAAEAELYFYGRVFGFDPADDLTPVVIHHSDALG
jgi:dipeptidyl aminopeptidase/acylaminoacyl peptidase